MSLVRIEAYSMTAKADKAWNLERFLSFMEESAARGTKLLLFPELSLTGLPEMLSMAWPHPESLQHFHGNAEPVPEGESVQKLIEKAKVLGLYVCWSMTELDKENRFRNATMVDAPKGQVLLYSFMPMKYCRYGFSLMCFTVHSSLHFRRCLISSAPKAIRAGCAGWPLLTNCAAYRSSAASHGTSAASLTQSFPWSSVPYGKIKSSIRS